MPNAWCWPSTSGQEASPFLTKAVRIMTLYRLNEKAWADAQAWQHRSGYPAYAAT
jgi:hypothetical protein